MPSNIRSGRRILRVVMEDGRELELGDRISFEPEPGQRITGTVFDLDHIKDHVVMVLPDAGVLRPFGLRDLKRFQTLSVPRYSAFDTRKHRGRSLELVNKNQS